MQVTGIIQSGCSNTLMWAIKSHANIGSDRDLISLINDETFYFITLSDVNLFELFRLTQVYRNKLRVVDYNKITMPNDDTINKLFGGESTVNENTFKHNEITKVVIEAFTNLSDQMMTDNNIISNHTAQMFMPMINHTYTVRIPYGFADLVYAINKNDEVVKKVFSDQYPSTLQTIDQIDPMLYNVILMNIMRLTTPIHYSQHYEDLLKVSKYFPLAKQKSNSLSNVKLLGIHKYNALTHGETRCSMFQVNKEVYQHDIAILQKLNTPYKFDFAISMPIIKMAQLENLFSSEEIEVRYESSINNIISSGIPVDSFCSVITTDDKTSTEVQSIEAYKTRIKDAELMLMNTIAILMNADKMLVDETSIFSLLPAISTTKAVITLNERFIDSYSTSNPEINSVLSSMVDIMTSVINS